MPETQAIPKGLPPGKYLHQIRALPMHFRQELDGFYRQMQQTYPAFQVEQMQTQNAGGFVHIYLTYRV
ncbi:MAG: hypothetical protein HFG00_12020 [Oscillibacter sp.]|nr:hypothetical protein [Oscillibacter sp.]